MSQDAKVAVQKEDAAKATIEARIRELDAIATENFGKDNVYYALRGQCYTLQTPEYRYERGEGRAGGKSDAARVRYELCPFDKVTQRNADGGGGTDMGRWKKESGWVDKGERAWQFADGLG
jgi:hypothetical protein